MIRNCSLAALTVFLATATGCEQSAPGAAVVKKVGSGKLTGKTYAHEHFGLSITFPDDWYVATDEEKDELMEMGTDLVVGENENDRAAYQAAKSRTLNMVSAFELPPGTPVERFNANIIIMAESVKGLPGIKTGREFIQQLEMNLRNSAMKIDFGDVEETKLGSRTVHRVDTRMQVGGMEVRQSYYATRVGDYALAFILSYGDDDQRAALVKILEGMKFAP